MQSISEHRERRPPTSYPEARFFAELAPGYAAGECLLVWLPLDLVNVAGGLLRLLRRRLAS